MLFISQLRLVNALWNKAGHETKVIFDHYIVFPQFDLIVRYSAGSQSGKVSKSGLECKGSKLPKSLGQEGPAYE